MAKMFRRFCDLPKHDANAIVVYFGVYSVARLAAFQQDHWKDTFAQWQKRHPNRDGTERAMVLPPPQLVVLRGLAATFYGSSGPQGSLESTDCARITSSPSVPRWNVRRRGR